MIGDVLTRRRLYYVLINVSIRRMAYAVITVQWLIAYITYIVIKIIIQMANNHIKV
jgi:hypothetical protein